MLAFRPWCALRMLVLRSKERSRARVLLDGPRGSERRSQGLRVLFQVWQYYIHLFLSLAVWGRGVEEIEKQREGLDPARLARGDSTIGVELKGSRNAYPIKHDRTNREARVSRELGCSRDNLQLSFFFPLSLYLFLAHTFKARSIFIQPIAQVSDRSFSCCFLFTHIFISRGAERRDSHIPVVRPFENPQEENEELSGNSERY